MNVKLMVVMWKCCVLGHGPLDYVDGCGLVEWRYRCRQALEWSGKMGTGAHIRYTITRL